MKKLILTTCLMVGAAFASFGGVIVHSGGDAAEWHFSFSSHAVYGIEFSAPWPGDYGWYDFNNPGELQSGYATSISTGYLGEFKAGDAIGMWFKVYNGTGYEIYTFAPTDIWNFIGAGVSGGGFCEVFFPPSSYFDYVSFRIVELAPLSGQPLPGVMAALAIGGCIFLGRKLKNRVKR